MSKKRFVQAVLARSLPAENKRSAALDYAEELWAFLSQHGYGDLGKEGEKKTRVSHDYYADLDERQKRYFNAFWNAFSYRTGRNEAADAWQRLGNMTDGQYQKIIDAADREAKRDRPEGQARMQAQGWLNRKRFDDYQPTQKHAKTVANLALNGLVNELAAIKRLYGQGRDEALLPQIAKLESAIKAARQPKPE